VYLFHAHSPVQWTTRGEIPTIRLRHLLAHRAFEPSSNRISHEPVVVVVVALGWAQCCQIGLMFTSPNFGAHLWCAGFSVQLWCACFSAQLWCAGFSAQLGCAGFSAQLVLVASRCVVTLESTIYPCVLLRRVHQQRMISAQQQRREQQRRESTPDVSTQTHAALTSEENTEKKRRLRHIQQELHGRHVEEEGILKVGQHILYLYLYLHSPINNHN